MNPNLFSIFIGPKAENIDALKEFIVKILDDHAEWRKSKFAYDTSLYPEQITDSGSLTSAVTELLNRHKKNVPYFHPRYAAQMLKDPTLTAILGNLIFLLSNPNNHAYEGGPVTTELELEVVDWLLKMCGIKDGWGHLTSGGSLANTEALWAIRDHYPPGAVIFSQVSHYSWKRICSILKINDFIEAPVDKAFRMDMNFVEEQLKQKRVTAIVANLGSTGSGSIDDISALVELRSKYGFHLHIDAAYGGFFRSMILDEANAELPFDKDNVLSAYTHRQLSAMKFADSITIDPHKQGLVSYGAGAVLFRDHELKKVILNTAPYTYHLTDKPNLGMISLEGSRPGAMAAACWLTYRVLPLHQNGLGAVLKESIYAANIFYELIDKSDMIEQVHAPDLDICCCSIRTNEKSIQALNEANTKVYKALSLEAENPEFILSKFIIPPEIAKKVFPEHTNDADESATLLRIVFMKHWYGMDDFRYIKMMIDTIEKSI